MPSEIVIADTADYMGTGIESRGFESLIGTLAAPSHSERASYDCFTLFGAVRSAYNKIHIERTYNCDSGQTLASLKFSV